MRTGFRPCSQPGRPIRFCLSALLLACLLRSGSAQGASGDDSPPAGEVSIKSIEIGLGGNYKVGEWTVARVAVTVSQPMALQLAVEAPDPDDLLSRFTGPVIECSAAATVHRLDAVFRTGRVNGLLNFLVLNAAGHRLATRSHRVENSAGAPVRQAWRVDRPLHVVLGETALAEATGRTAPTSADAERLGALELVRVSDPASLPRDWRALQSVESLILLTAAGKSDVASALSAITDESSGVIRDWVAMGGHLVLSVGSAAEEFRNSPLAAWVPVSVERKTGFRQMIGLESFTGGASPLRFSGAVPGAQLGSLSDKNILAKEVSGPIAVRVPYGFGRVTVLALDLDRPPLAAWPLLPGLVAKLVGAPLSTSNTESRQQNRQLSQLGMTDLASQFQSAQEDFATISRPSHWWVMGIILLYIIVIGPLDYLIVHRVLRHPEWTWATFPLMAAGGAAIAIWNADGINGTQVQCNQFDLVDYDIESSRVRGRTWVSVYSPQAERFDLSVQPAGALPDRQSSDSVVKPSDVQLAWQGFPENTVGGIYRTGSVNLGRHGYVFEATAGAVRDFPVSKWSTKSLTAWWDRSNVEAVAESSLTSAGVGNLTGAVTHHLPFALEDCLLAVGGWAYLPTSKDATLAPHTEWQPTGPLARQRDLKALLTGAQTRRRQKSKTESEILTITEPYNPQSHDRSRIVPMLTFHNVAGGAQYTGLQHAALRELELTNLMNAGRAVLIGRARVPVSKVEINGKPSNAQHETYVRLVLPVNFVHSAAPDQLMKPK